MSKRVMIGVLAAVGMMAMWWADTEAATCLQYRTIGGSSVCSKWSTKGVQLELTFKEACLSGESAGCFAVATATTTDSVAFCEQTNGDVIRVNDCTAEVDFSGNSFSEECVPKHDDKDPAGPGVGHEHHGCAVTFTLTPDLASCTTSCCNRTGGPGGTCIDVTPVEMDTTIIVTAAGSEGGGDTCAPDDASCRFDEHCSINPKKIVFIDPDYPNLSLSREYQCNLQCVGSACLPPPPPPCEIC